MQSNCLTHILLYFFVCGSSGYTTRKVRNICAIVVLTGFNDDQVAIHTLSLPFDNLYLCLRSTTRYAKFVSSSPFQLCLLEDACKRLGMYIVVQVSRNGHSPRLFWVFVLPMTPFGV